MKVTCEAFRRPGRLNVARRRWMIAVVLSLDIVCSRSPVAASLVGTLAYVTNFDDGTVSIIDVEESSVIDAVPVGEGPIGVAVTPDQQTVLVANFMSNSVSFLDTTTAEVTTELAVDGAANSIAITPDGRRAYVTNTSPGSVAVIDIPTRRVAKWITVGPQPAGIALALAGSRAFVANFGANTVSVIDTVEDVLITTFTLSEFLAVGPLGVAVSPDGLLVYVTAVFSDVVHIIDASQLGSIGYFITGGPEAVAVSPGGTLIYLLNS